jgi:NAD(P)-dependent dehydrogenase (short-subunit alcohol dehydrogenase family)
MLSDMTLLEGKTVIVSGVGPGLGREIAEAAARDGANVVMGARTESNLEHAAAEIDSDGKRVAWRATDITDAAQCKALVDTAVERFGQVDGLVNVAAYDTPMGGLEEMNWDDVRRAAEVNIIGTLQMTQAVIPPMKERGGSIVFVGSQTSYRYPGVLQLAYASTKHAQVGAITHLAHELGPYGIRLNTVVPFWMWGPMVEGYVNSAAEAQGVDPETLIKGFTHDHALGKMPTDGDVADAVTFFLSDRSRMITSQQLFVNAGAYSR